ncbi:MAG: hypothetical protein J5746_08705 [Victivallales bacterium]|nr:hypothetical protein [Victivallales bacterium]
MKTKGDISGVIPWWTLNGRLDEAEALRQLDDFAEKGVHEVFLYPNFGLEAPDFLSEEWFGFIAFLLNECPKRDFRLWIYDDLNWPSGAAGGHLCKQFPQYRMRTIRRREWRLAPGEAWQPSDEADHVWTGVFSAEHTLPQELPPGKPFVNDTKDDCRIVSLERRLVDDHFFSAMGTTGTWNEPGILDALNPAAVRAWMSFTYEPYLKRFPQALGTLIRGFFFDEPTMVSPFHTGDIPWTPGLEDAFFKQYGYDCRPRYWTLFEEASGQEQFRYDFWRFVARRFAASFTGQLSEWCSKNGLILSGHCWPEEPSCQRLMTTATGDVEYLQRHLQMPGTDFLYCENPYVTSAGMCPNKPGWPRNLIYSAKLPSSVARYNGARNTICESSGVCELGDGCVAPSAQKIAYDFLYAMGINVMNPARPYDMTDFRKYACALDAAQPYWRHYRLLVDYLNRLHEFNGRGKTAARLAVLSPLSARFALSDITQDTSIRNETTPLPPHGDLAPAMLATLDALMRGHIDFELLFEDVLLDSAVSPNGKLLAPQSAFKVIILPQCWALDDAVWQQLNAFAKRGGKLVVVGEAPTFPLRHGAAALPVEELPAVMLSPVSPDFAEQLLGELASMLAPEYRLEGKDNDGVLAQLREDGEWRGLFLANATPDDKVLQLSGPLSGRLRSLVDLQDGRAWRCPSAIPLKEAQSLLLTTDEPPKDAVIFGAKRQHLLTLPSAGWRIEGDVRNVMRMELEYLAGNSFRPMDDDGFFPEPLDPDVTPTVTLRGSFVIKGRVPINLRLWFDREGFSALTVNGMAINEEARHEKLFDPKNVIVQLASHCHPGRNVLTVTIPLSPWMSRKRGIRVHFTPLLQVCTPPLLLGSFLVGDGHELEELPTTRNSGSLSEQGFPFFCSELAVSMVFDATTCQEETWLDISPCPLPIAAELNGRNLGTRLWRNGSLPIHPGTLKPKGNCLVLRLCGDIWNTLGRRWIGRPVPPVPFILPKLTILR